MAQRESGTLTTRPFRYIAAVHKARARSNPNAVRLGLELLCNAFPIGALILDSEYRLLFINREGSELLRRWSPHGAKTRHAQVPPEVIAACESLRSGVTRTRMRGRPDFGGRVLVRHPQKSNLSAVVALERSLRDRRVAVFCVFLNDRLNDNVAGGRRDQLAMLTVAERRVAKLVADGLSNREIAESLGKSITTVKAQLGAIFAKLEVRSRTQLTAALRSW